MNKEREEITDRSVSDEKQVLNVVNNRSLAKKYRNGRILWQQLRLKVTVKANEVSNEVGRSSGQLSLVFEHPELNTGLWLRL